MIIRSPTDLAINPGTATTTEAAAARDGGGQRLAWLRSYVSEVLVGGFAGDTTTGSNGDEINEVFLSNSSGALDGVESATSATASAAGCSGCSASGLFIGGDRLGMETDE